MKYTYYIARRLAFQKSFSRLIIRIGIAGITISLTVMLASVAILTGFKKEITNKVIGFGSHIQVRALDMNESFQGTPVRRRQDFIPAVSALPGVTHIQPYANKAGIIKTETDVQGIIIKGVDKSYDFTFLKDNLVEGRLPEFGDSTTSQDIFVSKYIAGLLRVKVGDQLPIYFIQEPIRVRSLKVCGLFETGLEDYDKQFALADLRHIQKLNGWGDTLVQGFEILINDIKQLEATTEQVNDLLPVDMKAYSAKQLKPQIFDWLNLLDTNVLIIMILMIAVACINMITALLVLIIERTNMIGILKALGSTNSSLRRIFMYKAAWLIGQGLLLGNLLGLGLLFYQKYTQHFTLDPQSYYLSFVPVNIDWLAVLIINAGVFVICTLAMLLPTLLVARITPVKAIRFD